MIIWCISYYGKMVFRHKKEFLSNNGLLFQCRQAINKKGKLTLFFKFPAFVCFVSIVWKVKLTVSEKESNNCFLKRTKCLQDLIFRKLDPFFVDCQKTTQIHCFGRHFLVIGFHKAVIDVSGYRFDVYGRRKIFVDKASDSHFSAWSIYV